MSTSLAPDCKKTRTFREQYKKTTFKQIKSSFYFDNLETCMHIDNQLKKSGGI